MLREGKVKLCSSLGKDRLKIDFDNNCDIRLSLNEKGCVFWGGGGFRMGEKC